MPAGCNDSGQLAAVPCTAQPTPQRVQGLPAGCPILFVAAGADHSLVVLDRSAGASDGIKQLPVGEGALQLLIRGAQLTDCCLPSNSPALPVSPCPPVHRCTRRPLRHPAARCPVVPAGAARSSGACSPGGSRQR